MHDATVSPVPALPAALLPARSCFLAVPAWAHGEEPYSYPVPARHVLFSLPARSSVLAVPAWAHGEEPYGYPVPACHALAYTYGLANTSQTADHINRQLVKQQRLYLFTQAEA